MDYGSLIEVCIIYNVYSRESLLPTTLLFPWNASLRL
jgi:hypothetical protein